MALSRDAILAAEDRTIEEVPVPEWGGSVFVKSLTGSEADANLAAQLTSGRRDFSTYHAETAAACICDESGAALFTRADIDALGRKSAAALGRVVKVAQRLNGLTAEDEAAVVKNSPTASPGADSGSGLQA